MCALCRFDEAYSWQYVNCCVHNIIVGKIWIEHVSDVTNFVTVSSPVSAVVKRLSLKDNDWFVL